MKKIEITKGENKYIFQEPFANDLLEFKIDNGEIQNKLIELQKRAKKFKDLKDDNRTEQDNMDINELVSEINLSVAKKDKLNFAFAVKNLISVESKDYSLETIKGFQVPISFLSDVTEAFAESLTVENLGK